MHENEITVLFMFADNDCNIYVWSKQSDSFRYGH
jgi:hypothetical protein